MRINQAPLPPQICFPHRPFPHRFSFSVQAQSRQRFHQSRDSFLLQRLLPSVRREQAPQTEQRIIRLLRNIMRQCSRQGRRRLLRYCIFSWYHFLCVFFISLGKYGVFIYYIRFFEKTTVIISHCKNAVLMLYCYKAEVNLWK